ncbi:MAG: hypothetical protein Q9213_006310 [Squamulea squamosa]
MAKFVAERAVSRSVPSQALPWGVDRRLQRLMPASKQEKLVTSSTPEVSKLHAPESVTRVLAKVFEETADVLFVQHAGVDVNWIVALALTGLYTLFLLGMSGSSLQFVFQNTTTIENLSRKTKVWQLAIHIPNASSQPDKIPPYRTITYGQDPNTTRTFAILHSKPGENPWDLGYFRNFKSVMGERWYDWILPIRRSPYTNHDRQDCEFEIGPVVERMKREAGISSTNHINTEEKPRRHRRRRQRRSTRTRSEDPTAENDEVYREEKKRHHRHHRRHSESRRDSGVNR